MFCNIHRVHTGMIWTGGFKAQDIPECLGSCRVLGLQSPKSNMKSMRCFTPTSARYSFISYSRSSK